MIEGQNLKMGVAGSLMRAAPQTVNTTDQHTEHNTHRHTTSQTANKADRGYMRLRDIKQASAIPI
jgi:hypothetical protein